MNRSNGVGRFSVEFDLANYSDVVAVELGVIQPDQIRSMRVSGMVDTGATDLVLPKSVVDQLGLRQTGNASVRYADGRREPKRVVGFAKLDLLGRYDIFSAIEEPNRNDALIGAIVLEELDLVVDCKNMRLEPRDPNQILAEIE